MPSSPVRDDALRIVREGFEAFTMKHLPRLVTQLQDAGLQGRSRRGVDTFPQPQARSRRGVGTQENLPPPWFRISR